MAANIQNITFATITAGRNKNPINTMVVSPATALASSTDIWKFSASLA